MVSSLCWLYALSSGVQTRHVFTLQLKCPSPNYSRPQFWEAGKTCRSAFRPDTFSVLYKLCKSEWLGASSSTSNKKLWLEIQTQHVFIQLGSVKVQIIIGLNLEKQEKLVDLHSDPTRFPLSTNRVSPNNWGTQVLEATKSCGLKFRPGPFARASLLLIYTLCAGSINRTRANFSIKIQTRHVSFLNKPNARKLLYRNSDRACLCASVFDAFNPGLNWKRARGLLCQNSVQIRLWLLGLMSFHPYLLFSYHCNFFAVHSAYIIKGLYNSDRKFLLPYIFLPVSWSVFFYCQFSA